MRCAACGAEMMVLTKVVRDAVPDVEHHTFICSACYTTERRVVFTRHGREDDSEPVLALPTVRASKAQEKHSAAPGLFSRVVARIRGHYGIGDAVLGLRRRDALGSGNQGYYDARAWLRASYVAVLGLLDCRAADDVQS